LEVISRICIVVLCCARVEAIRSADAIAADPGQALAIFLELNLEALDLSLEEAILVVSGLGGLLQVLNLGLQIFQVLLLSLTEGALGCTVLRFPLLEWTVRAVMGSARATYGSRLGCKRLPTRLLCGLVLAFTALSIALIFVVIIINAFPLIVEVSRW
jgi:hypothetical protein